MACWLPRVSCGLMLEPAARGEVGELPYVCAVRRVYARTRARIRSKSRELHQLHQTAGDSGPVYARTAPLKATGKVRRQSKLSVSRRGLITPDAVVCSATAAESALICVAPAFTAALSTAR